MLSDNLKALRLAKRVSQEDVATFLEISKSAYGYYESGRNMPSVEVLLKLAKYFDTTTDQLLDRAPVVRNIKPIRVPVLGRVPAGTPIEAIEDIIDWEELNPSDYNPVYDYFGLVVIGESMAPKYLDGDTIIVQRIDDADSGTDVVAYVNGHDATLKRLTKNTNGSVTLSPLNPSYQAMSFSPDDVNKIPVKVIGVVKEIRRKV